MPVLPRVIFYVGLGALLFFLAMIYFEVYKVRKSITRFTNEFYYEIEK